jgi:mono/diheme cytochrome c family protein
MERFNPFFRCGLPLLLGCLAVGCQQKMADQPYQRPYSENSLFEYNQASRPLEAGVVHRNQPLNDDPLITWLTPQGKAVKADPAWTAAVDPTGKTVPPPGAPSDVANFVNDFPFEMHEADLKRGRLLYNANCALCHGGAGHANGKIPERGFLRPPSYHTDPAGKAKDWSTLAFNDQTNKPEPRFTENPQGTSRGFYRYGKTVPLKDAPVGYIFQVITWGYGGMAAHDTQIADPADRWRVVAYIRALQLSQGASAADVPDAAKKIEDSKKAAEKKPATGGHH